ncbi:hypothetical protein [uncultured Kordia sp.]|uniref:hypothetical protein n=1 Tax=uncultured Kordia sp. TaxID=507699 RepID=UPI0026281581|nr:hypothetical protein [uncultured Kordia sp.]
MRPSFVTLENHSAYVMKTDGSHLKFFMQLLAILQPLFMVKEIYTIEVKNGKLIIELRSEKLHFDIFEKLLNM